MLPLVSVCSVNAMSTQDTNKIMERQRIKYSPANLADALAAVRSGRSVYSVSKEFGIPKTTLLYKHTGKLPVGKAVGPPTILSFEEEAELIRWIMTLSQRGFPITRIQLLNSVQQLIKQLDRQTPFKNGRPGRHWYAAFTRRHPELTERVAQNLSYCRSSITEEHLQQWFTEVKNYLEERDLLDIDQSRIFNCDESAFFLCPKGDRVLVRKGEKAVYCFTHNNDKECLTTLFMANAKGMLPPPMVVFAYERIPHSISASMPRSWALGKTERGWMTSETFFEYISNVFEPWLTDNNIQRPVVLYVDGHSSHLTLPLSKFCNEKQIELIALYPNATHIMQPLDVALFRPLKAAWKKATYDWRMENNGNRLRREDFASVLKKAVETLNLEVIMMNGFKACGLSPFTAEALKHNKILQKQKNTDLCQSTANANSADKKQIIGHLQFIEATISQNILSAFKEAENKGDWNGSTEDRSLFMFWSQVRRMAGVSTTSPPIPIQLPENSNSVREEVSIEEESHGTISILEDEISFPLDDITIAESNETGVTVRQEVDDIGFEVSSDGIFIEDHAHRLDIEGITIEERVEGFESEETLIEVWTDECEVEQSLIEQPTDEGVFEKDQDVNAASTITLDVTAAIAIAQDVASPGVEGQATNPSRIPEGVPSPFKKTLFWPGMNSKKKNLGSKSKQKLPSVATSKQWTDFKEQEEAEKMQKQRDIEVRKKKRQEAAAEKLRVQMEIQERKKQRQEASAEKKRKQEEVKAIKLLEREEKKRKRAEEQAKVKRIKKEKLL